MGGRFFFRTKSLNVELTFSQNIHEYYASSDYKVNPNHPDTQYLVTTGFSQFVSEETKAIKKLGNNWRSFLFATGRTQETDLLRSLPAAPSTNQATNNSASQLNPPEITITSPTVTDTTSPEVETPVKRKRGRPLGSKNKPKDPNQEPRKKPKC